MKIWIIGAGTIAQEYAKIVTALGYEYIAVGRGAEKAEIFRQTLHHDVIEGGLEKFIASQPEIPECAIVATNLSSLSATCNALMDYGVRNILCEKPGFLFPEECVVVAKNAENTHSHLYLAYNRRFYASTLAAEKIIQEDGGLKSLNFEFTEWGHVIEKLDKPQADLKNWFYANSSHVVDLAFFIGGAPKEMTNYVSGEMSWHKPAAFAGAGITDKGALFSYQANWAAPGRWGVELLTAKHRLYLRPMEQLQIQELGKVAINPVEIDDHIDKEFKPGFFLETKSFLNGDSGRLCSIEEQLEHVNNIYTYIIGK